MYTFTKRVPFLKPWLWNRRSLPGRKWRQSRPKWQPKFIQEPHSPRILQSNNTWNSCSYKWRPSGKNHLKTLVIFRKVLQNWCRVQAKTCAVSKVRMWEYSYELPFSKIRFYFPACNVVWMLTICPRILAINKPLLSFELFKIQSLFTTPRGNWYIGIKIRLNLTNLNIYVR